MEKLCLLLRPDPYHDESFRGYILRLSELNGYSDSKMLFRFLGLQRYNHFDNLLIPKEPLNLIRLTEITQKPEETLSKMVMYNRITSSESNPSTELLHNLWRHGTCPHKQRFCPICLEEKSYHRDIWEFSMVTTCPTHNCLLIDYCQNCNLHIKPYRQKLLHCICGFDYRSSEVQRVESTFSQYFHARYYNNFESIKVLESMDMFHFIALVVITIKIINGIQENTRRPNFSIRLQSSNLPQSLDQVLHLFYDWPFNFYQYLDK